MPNEEYSFPPIIGNNSKILILGSFPSVLSVKNSFYYGNKRNQFWKIMNDIFQENATTNEEKEELVLRKGIALWDSVKRCERKNSSDSKLVVMEANNIRQLLRKYPRIHTLFFNGKKAFQVFQKAHKNIPIYIQILPSTSPANAAMKYEEKLRIYKMLILERLEPVTSW